MVSSKISESLTLEPRVALSRSGTITVCSSIITTPSNDQMSISELTGTWSMTIESRILRGSNHELWSCQPCSYSTVLMASMSLAPGCHE